MNSKPDILPGPALQKCKCGNSIALFTHAIARYCGCSACGRYYKIDTGQLEVEKKFVLPTGGRLLPVGCSAVFNGSKFVLTGAVIKKDKRYDFQWREYTFYHPIKGYCYLSEYDGHWMLLSEAPEYPVGPSRGSGPKLDGQQYWLYARYSPEVVWAIGEFGYDVFDDEKLTVQEYIAPPSILIKEYDDHSIQWFIGEYWEQEEVAAALNIKRDELPWKKGIGVIQPQQFDLDFISAIKLSVAAALIALCIQLILGSFQQNKEVGRFSGTANSVTNTTQVSPSFKLTGGTANLEYTLNTGVSNSWLETDATLVNEQTGEDFDFTVGAEYYSGYDGGESWSEGSRTATTYVNAVPEGTYHLLINPVSGTDFENYSIELKRDVPVWGNYIMFLLLFAIGPIVQYLRERSFEKQRWMDSDYSPFDQE